ncbi:hypothetical protein NUW54_g122 [Trametes sanguinea]|uniref:Uncharacterized protein n=1 Tax=Trametes sanguinea TaxID=158606 RepID=A0ACC1QA21_9APHY|nr:hypothetical protein NUW54_g122 [Trametes sanguinea]
MICTVPGLNPGPHPSFSLLLISECFPGAVACSTVQLAPYVTHTVHRAPCRALESSDFTELDIALRSDCLKTSIPACPNALKTSLRASLPPPPRPNPSLHPRTISLRILCPETQVMAVSEMTVALIASATATLIPLLLWLCVSGLGLGQRRPPGPQPKPLIGNLPDLPSGPHEWLEYADMSRKYRSDVLFFKVLRTPLLVINTFEAARDLLEKKGVLYSDRPRMVMIKELMQWDWNLILMSYGKRFTAYRRVVQQEFQPNAIPRLHHSVMTREVLALVHRLLEAPDDLVEHLKHLAGGIIMVVTYGHEVKSVTDEYVAIAEAVREHAEARPGIELVDVLPPLKYLPTWFPGASFHRVAKIARELSFRMRTEPFEMVKAQMAAGTAVPCMATRLLSQELSCEDVDPEEFVKNCCGVVYSAGADTTTAALRNFTLAMMTYPEVQVRAQGELDRVVGRDRLPTFDDRTHLPYISRIVKESLRWKAVSALGPLLCKHATMARKRLRSSTGVPHATLDDDEYYGGYIPKGTTVLANIYGMLHDESIYSNPDDFNPDRFLPTPGKPQGEPDPMRAAFGFGRRICPGRFFAEDSLFIAIASMLHVFKISPPDGTDGADIVKNVRWSSGLVRHVTSFYSHGCSLDAPATATNRDGCKREARDAIVALVAATDCVRHFGVLTNVIVSPFPTTRPYSVLLTASELSRPHQSNAIGSRSESRSEWNNLPPWFSHEAEIPTTPSDALANLRVRHGSSAEFAGTELALDASRDPLLSDIYTSASVLSQWTACLISRHRHDNTGVSVHILRYQSAVQNTASDFENLRSPPSSLQILSDKPSGSELSRMGRHLRNAIPSVMADRNQEPGVTEVAPSSSSSSSAEVHARKGARFWTILGCLVLGTFLCVLESYATSTALPTIVRDLHSGDFVWVASAYALSSTALLPLSGGLAEMFGRRQVILGSLAVFIVGSAISGAAQSMNMLIAGRAVHGAGAGGITTLSQIILSDLVTLRERGTYNGLFGLTWAIGGGVGPIIGGSLAHHTIWRWIFYLNVPAGAVIALLLLFLLRLRRPPTVKRTFREVMGRIDLLGNLVLIGASCACAIALTWGGIQFPWQSSSVLVPLCLGIAGFFVWALYEWRFCSYPVVPAHLLLNRTSFSGLLHADFSGRIHHCQPALQVLLHCEFTDDPDHAGMPIDYLPVYYQACKDASPAASGIDLFGLCFSTGPMAIITGISIGKSKVYRPQLWVGWCLITVGVGLMNTITEDSHRSLSIGFQIVAGIGIGILYSAAYFPVLAPLPVTSTAFALSFYVFLRSFAQIWGVTIGGALLQNELQRRLPLTVQNAIPGLNNVAYAVIPLIPTMAQPEKDLTRKAFAESLAIIWRMLTAVAGVGLIASLFMRGLPLHTQRDENWAVAVESGREVDDAEKPED